MTADFFEVVQRQRACRTFTEDAVDEQEVAQLLDAATFAPSAENSQPWRFVVVSEPDQRAAIGELTRRAWEGGAREYEEGRLPEHLLADVNAGATGGVAAAPVIIVVCGDRSATVEVALASSIWPAVQNLLLAATALGLGSALTTLATTFGDELAHVLDLPEELRPMAVIPIGHPTRRLGPPRRQPWPTKTFWRR